MWECVWGVHAVGYMCVGVHLHPRACGGPSPQEPSQRQGLCVWEAEPGSSRARLQPSPWGLGSCREPPERADPTSAVRAPVLPRGTGPSSLAQHCVLREPPPVSVCLDAPRTGSSLLLTAPSASLSPPRSGRPICRRPCTHWGCPWAHSGTRWTPAQPALLGHGDSDSLGHGVGGLHRCRLPSHPSFNPSGWGGGSRPAPQAGEPGTSSRATPSCLWEPSPGPPSDGRQRMDGGLQEEGLL